MQEIRVRSLAVEDPLEEEMAIHSSIHAWRTPWTEEPGRLQAIGPHRIRHDWRNLAFTRAIYSLHNAFTHVSWAYDQYRYTLLLHWPHPINFSPPNDNIYDFCPSLWLLSQICYNPFIGSWKHYYIALKLAVLEEEPPQIMFNWICTIVLLPCLETSLVPQSPLD